MIPRKSGLERHPEFLKRKMHRAVLVLLILFSASITPPDSAAAQDGRGYLEMSGGYLTGDFGTQIESDLYYISPALGYVTPRLEVSVTVPYLRLTVENEADGQSNTESGVGDIFLRGGYVLMPESKSGTSLDGLVALKIPTADEARGLGTGETDYGASLSIHQRFEKFKLSLMGGYIKVGDPSFIDFNDVYVYGIGLTRLFRLTELSASFEGRRSLLPGFDDPKELHIRFFHLLNRNYSIKGGAFTGLNDGGPDFGMNLGIVRWF